MDGAFLDLQCNNCGQILKHTGGELNVQRRGWSRQLAFHRDAGDALERWGGQVDHRWQLAFGRLEHLFLFGPLRIVRIVILKSEVHLIAVGLQLVTERIVRLVPLGL